MNLSERLEILDKSVGRLEVYRDIISGQIADNELEATKLKALGILNQKSSEVFKGWLEDLLANNVDSMAQLVSSGLQHIIDDQDLTFKIKKELKYNKVSMCFAVESDGMDGDPLHSFGGGVVSVISLILRLAVMARMQMGNLLLLDESMDALHSSYIPAAVHFMKQLSEQTGINILMVTHNDDFANGAHTAYEGKKDKYLKLHKKPTQS